MKRLVPGDAVILDGQRHQVVGYDAGLQSVLLDNGCGGPHAVWSSLTSDLAASGATRVPRAEQLRRLMAERNALLGQVTQLRTYLDMNDDQTWDEVLDEVRRIAAVAHIHAPERSHEDGRR